MTQNSILRQKAREALGGNIFAKNWLMTLLVFLVYSAIVSVVGAIPVVSVVALIIITGPFAYGISRVLVKRARGQGDVEISEMFIGFTENFGQSFLLELLIGVYTFLWSLLFVIPGIVKAYSYSMAFYIMQDDPSKGWKTCIDESRNMMNGYKWKLFCLDLSFIGWYFVGALCFGVGTLFVYPYHNAARAQFYLDLKGDEPVAAEAEATEF